jgi:4a-hydroxytetrahydrobiopterin dehydratase
MSRRKLSVEEIREQIGELDGWTHQDACLMKRFTFPDFAKSLDFINRVGAVAETHDHHPDVKIGWGYAEISTTTHDSGGITEKDIELVREIDEIR